MGSVLALIEHTSGVVSKGQLTIIDAALKAKEAHGCDSVIGLVLGSSGTKDAASSVASYGLDKIVTLEDPALEHTLAIQVSEAISQAVEQIQPDLVLALASSVGKDSLPRVGAKRNMPQASDVIEFVANRSYKRPMYAGNIIATVELEGDAHLATVRASAFDQPSSSGGSSAIESMSVQLEAPSTATFVAFDTVKSERPELSEADVVVSGGRALKSEENFESVIFPLADALGAAVGASRAAVDSGYAPNDWQVGQTGKIVAPKLYIALGISGAVQHLAGMKDSKVIVAVNKDPEAPIFEVADYGLVADLFDVVPELVKALQ